MAGAAIQVVLQEDVPTLGKSGDLVRVKPGYARNYLLPRGLAAIATRGSVTKIEHAQKAAVARSARLRKDAEGLAARLSKVEIEFKAPAGDTDKLFGSIGAKDVADRLEALGFEIDRRKVVLDPIKTLGDHVAQVRLGLEVIADVKVKVVRDS